MIHSFQTLPRTFCLSACLAGILSFAASPLAAADVTPAHRALHAANAFLETLSAEQREQVQYDLNDAEQRVRWSNLPVRSVEHGGLRIGDLTEDQRAAAMDVLKAVLSEKGFWKVDGIVESDEVLRREGGNSMFGRDQYFISFMGKPSATEPWRIQYGGHHLGLNVTLAGNKGVLTPSLIAVQPARFEWNGETVRPMEGETDKAFALVQSLNEAQRGKAVLGFQMRDLVLGPGHDGETVQPEGIRVSEFNDSQKEQLMSLIAEWAGIIHDAAAKEKLAEVRSNLDQTWFAWSGPLEAGKAYYRIQGPTVIIEYAPQRLGGDVTQHLHSMFRDPTNDYGTKLIGQ